MNTASIVIKTEPKLKIQAQQTAKELGVSLSRVMNALLKQFVKTKTINLSQDEEGLTLTPYAKKQIKKAMEDLKAGKASPVFTSDTKLIKKDPHHYRHIDTMEQWFDEQGI